MKEKALVFSENEFGKIDGKVANGLVRYSGRYEIVGVIDSSNAGLDAGEYLDGKKNGIPIFQSIDYAIENLNYIPVFSFMVSHRLHHSSTGNRESQS